MCVALQWFCVLLVQALRQIRESDLSLTEGDATLVVGTPTGGGGKGSAVSVSFYKCAGGWLGHVHTARECQ